MTYILVMYIYAGMLAKGDSVAISTIEGFTNPTTCRQAGEAAKVLVAGSAKDYRFVCLEKK